jgi:hypothetical protein
MELRDPDSVLRKHIGQVGTYTQARLIANNFEQVLCRMGNCASEEAIERPKSMEA